MGGRHGTARGGYLLRCARRGRANGMGSARRNRTARAAERHGCTQRGGAVLTCAGCLRAEGFGASMPKGEGQEEWRDACRCCVCLRLEDLLLVPG